MPLQPTRLILALPLAALLLAAAVGLARVDAGIGAPVGPDRLLAAIDADPLASGDTIQSADGSNTQPTDVATTASRAKAILDTRPIDGRAYRVLAQIADAQGDTARADALYAIAVRRAPRDRPTRAALADRAIVAGDYDAALAQLDALFRVAPSVRDPLLRRLVPALDDTRLLTALVARLATDPPWRGALRPVLLDKATPPQTGLTVLTALAKHTALTPQETDTRITLLQRSGNDAQARTLWRATLPAAEDAGNALLSDGSFEHPDLEGAYAWQQHPPAGVAMAQDDIAPAEGSHALAIDFSGRAVTAPGLSQALALPPGHYDFAFAADNRTDARRPFAWRLSCNAGGANLLSLSLPDASTQGWQHIEGSFEIPITACSGQTLRLDFLGRSLAERQLSGTLRVDAVGITSR